MIKDEATLEKKKGRSKAMIEARNEVILHRYYYYIKIRRLQYQDAINILSTEFFLKGITIIEVLGDNLDKMKEITESKPSIHSLIKRFGFMKWAS